MADAKLTDLAAYVSPNDNDPFELVDLDDLSMDPDGTNKQWTIAGFRAWLQNTFDHSTINHDSLQNSGGNTHADIDGHIGDTSIHPPDPARLTVRNDFTRAADAAVDNDYFQTGQIGQSGRFRLESASGFLTITARDDSGAQVGNALFGIAHGNNIAAQGLIIGNVAFPGAGALAAENGLYDGTSRVLTDVIQDVSPQLGGPLETKGKNIYLTRSDDTIWGMVGARTSEETAYLAYTRDGTYVETAGAVAVEAATVALLGSAIEAVPLAHSLEGGRQVWVSEQGVLYGVDPPPVGWTSSDTSTTTASMGSGTGAGAWIDTDLTINFGADVEIGQRLDVSVNLYIENRTDDKPGNISVGFGFNGATPTAPAATITIGEYFEGWVPVSFSTTADAAYTTANTVDIFVRRESSDDSNFNPWIAYEGTVPHEGILSTPGGSTPGGSGDMVAPGAMPTGNFYIATADPKITADAGFGSNDVARLDDTNTFTEQQTIEDAGGNAKLVLGSTDSQVPIRFNVNGGATDGQDWAQIGATAGVMQFLSTNDGGSGGVEQIGFGHSGVVGGVRIGSGATFQGEGTLHTWGKIYEQFIPVLYPPAVIVAGGSLVPTLDTGQPPRFHFTADSTINTPTGSDGDASFIKDAGVTITVSGYDDIHGTQVAAKSQFGYFGVSNGRTYIGFGAETA